MTRSRSKRERWSVLCAFAMFAGSGRVATEEAVARCERARMRVRRCALQEVRRWVLWACIGAHLSGCVGARLSACTSGSVTRARAWMRARVRARPHACAGACARGLLLQRAPRRPVR
eukprot:6189356-Pleurochrysis_carterae.AAC.1